MSIQAERILNDIETIARFTQTPGNGATRPTFSPEWGEARAYVIAQAEAAGCVVRTDAAGNVHARPAALDWETPAWLVGSHIDSVPHGGDYDGVAGVVVGMELLRSAAEDGIANTPIELIVFAEEEGPTFGLGMLGSKAWVGELSAEELGKLRNAAGQTYLDAGGPFGVMEGRIANDRLQSSRYLGLIEVHIEQGPGMWRRGEPLAVVRSIAGRQQFRVSVFGQANHAGATSMDDRSDALVTAARIIVGLEKLADGLAGSVITVGRIENHPNAVNVISERAEFTIDFRAPDGATLTKGGHAIRELIDDTCGDENQIFQIRQTESIAARPMDDGLIARLQKAGDWELPLRVSGALHDSAVLAPHVPTVMLFVPSKDGISHNPAEFSRIEDIAAAAQVVEKVIRQATMRDVDAMDHGAFISFAGRFFEHSPWIAERAWTKKPFGSVSNLHEVMCGIVRNASSDEQMSLIRAHPDLVGRLAREGRLTRESTGEQAAAGLSELSPDEAAAFERFNAAYLEKFGFPFVICARQNRKDAILAAFPRRLANTREAEIATALEEIYKIAQLRMNDAIWED